MDSKLQQAIIATRAGHTETAQILLTDMLQTNPVETEAWFLLAHLVESPERQARYLEYTLLLEPDHELARQHLDRLLNPDVPPPLIRTGRKQGSSPSHPTPAPTVDSVFSAIPPAKTNSALSVTDVSDSAYAQQESRSEHVVAEQNSSSVDMDWLRSAGKPKRATQTPPTSTVVQERIPSPAPLVEEEAQPANRWLLAILVVLVALAFFVFSFLAFTIFFQ